MKTISLLVYSRSDYTAEVLGALSRCDGIEGYQLVVYSHLPAHEPVLDVVRRSANFCDTTVLVEPPLGDDPRFGQGSSNVAAAVRRLFGMAFAELGSTFHVHFEDDTVPARDTLRYFEWTSARFHDDPQVLTVSAYTRVTEPVTADAHYKVQRRSAFTAWGWGTWRDRWHDTILPPWRNADFDWNIHNNIRGERCEVAPVLGRVQNIGALGGLHVNDPAWHRDNHWVPHWAGNTSLEPGEWHE